MVRFKPEGLHDLEEHGSTILGALVDTSVFPIRHELKKAGVEIDDIVVRDFGGTMLSGGLELTMGRDVRDYYDDEEMEVLLAHELAHVLWANQGKTGFNAWYGSGRPWDHYNATWWESLQASKLGWDEARYAVLVDKLRHDREVEFYRGSKEHRQILRLLAERPWTFRVMRRPVHVESHQRVRRS